MNLNAAAGDSGYATFVSPRKDYTRNGFFTNGEQKITQVLLGYLASRKSKEIEA